MRCYYPSSFNPVGMICPCYQARFGSGSCRSHFGLGPLLCVSPMVQTNVRDCQALAAAARLAELIDELLPSGLVVSFRGASVFLLRSGALCGICAGMCAGSLCVARCSAVYHAPMYHTCCAIVCCERLPLHCVHVVCVRDRLCLCGVRSRYQQ